MRLTELCCVFFRNAHCSFEGCHPLAEARLAKVEHEVEECRQGGEKEHDFPEEKKFAQRIVTETNCCTINN